MVTQTNKAAGRKKPKENGIACVLNEVKLYIQNKNSLL